MKNWKTLLLEMLESMSQVSFKQHDYIKFHLESTDYNLLICVFEDSSPVIIYYNEEDVCIQAETMSPKDAFIRIFDIVSDDI